MIKIPKDIQDIFFMIMLQGLNYVAPLLVYPYLMIVLGAEKFGIISFSLSFAQYFMLLIDFGFNLSATKRIAQAKSQAEKNQIFTSTIIFKSILLSASILLMFILNFLQVFPVYQETMWIMFIMVFANTYFFIWLFQGLGKIKVITSINIFSKLLILPLVFVFVKQPDDYRLAAFILSASYLLGMIINIIVMRHQKIIFFTKVNKAQVKEEIKESFPVFLSSASTSVYTSFFVVLLGIVSTPVVVGLYASAEKIMRSLCFLFITPIIQVFYPKLANMAIEKRHETKALYTKIFRYTMLLMALLMVSLMLFSSKITEFLGPDYYAAANYLRIMAIALIFIPLGAITGQLGLLALGDHQTKQSYKKVYLIAAPISLTLVSILGALYAGIGATVSLVATEIFVGIMMYYYFKRLIVW